MLPRTTAKTPGRLPAAQGLRHTLRDKAAGAGRGLGAQPSRDEKLASAVHSWPSLQAACQGTVRIVYRARAWTAGLQVQGLQLGGVPALPLRDLPAAGAAVLAAGVLLLLLRRVLSRASDAGRHPAGSTWYDPGVASRRMTRTSSPEPQFSSGSGVPAVPCSSRSHAISPARATVAPALLRPASPVT